MSPTREELLDALKNLVTNGAQISVPDRAIPDRGTFQAMIFPAVSAADGMTG